ncbi:GNAT family N-acetyltransferase [Pseudolabrys taiwanensis]|nr:GNAT family N-acetyltransferase [Pseudolabrys taiwanensis]
MTDADLPRVLHIAAAVHPSLPEDAAVFAERLALYPTGCLVHEHGGAVDSYVISHPWQDAAPPALNTLLGKLPATPSTYYIHDIALMPDARGSGVANTIVKTLMAHARQNHFATITLVAVNNSARFWRKHGFEAVNDRSLAAKIASYGADARLMRATLPPA